ncbi:MAG: 4Fe-4S binding protein [Alphaproteobacteria bacterium]|nr:4Fe-4S binding protein [Alphaproteobacteria bacterium]
MTSASTVRMKGAWWRTAPLTPGLRRVLQGVAFAVIVATPAVQLWGVGTARVWSEAELTSRYGPAAAQVNGFLRGTLGAPPDWLPGWLVGGAWSIRLGPVELADPIALLTVAFGGALPAASLLVGAALVLAFHVLFGRLFCAVLCPYGILSRQALRLRRPLKRWGLVHDVRLPRQVRWVVLAAVLAAPVFGGSIVAWALPYLAVTRVFHAALWGGLGASVAVVATMLLSDVLLWDTGVCRSLCPSGALQGLLGRFRLYRLQARSDRRCDKGCHNCASACWIGLDPRGGAPDPDCDGCGRCVLSCPNNRLQTMVRVPWRGAPVLLAGLLLAGSGVAQARAPEVIEGSRIEASPFMPPSDPELAAEITFLEVDHPCPDDASALCAVSIGTARMKGDEVALRVFLEEAPGDPYTGPLALTIENAEGATRVEFERPKHPRSVPEPTLYEGRLAASLPITVRFESGPMAGSAWTTARPPRAAALLVAPMGVVAVWALLFAGRLWPASGSRRRP